MLSRTRFARALRPTWPRLAPAYTCGALCHSWLLLRHASHSTDHTPTQEEQEQQQKQPSQSLFSVPSESKRSYAAAATHAGYDTLATQRVSMQDISHQVAQTLASRLPEAEAAAAAEDEEGKKTHTEAAEEDAGDAALAADAAALQEHAQRAARPQSAPAHAKRSTAEKEEEDEDVSHGEEELQEGKEAAVMQSSSQSEGYAEQELIDEARQSQAAMTQTQTQTQTTQTTTQTHQNDESGGNGTSEPAYIPVNLTHSSRFSRELSALLAEVAQARQFHSPIWSTAEAFAAADIKLTVPEEDGLRVTTMPPYPFYLYNLQQTDFPDAARASAEAVRAEVRRRVGLRTSQMNLPHDLVGFRLRSRTAAAIMEHPTFAQLQARSPVWISIQDIRLLNLHLRPGELTNYVLVPHDMRFRVMSHGGPSKDLKVFHDLMRDYGTPLGIDLTMYGVYYHSSQLVEAAQFAAVPEKLLYCWSIYGKPYGAGQSYLMREYCRRYFFPDNGLAVFVTMEQLERLGGTLVQTPRGPQSLQKATDTNTNTDTDTSTTADKAMSVVPPPFTMMCYGEVLTLYNAEQTDRPEFLQAYARRAKTELYDRQRPEGAGRHWNNNNNNNNSYSNNSYSSANYENKFAPQSSRASSPS